MTPPLPHWRARAPTLRQIRNRAAVTLRRLFVGVCVGIYLIGMTWMLWRIK
jgi:hypothetical protein